MSKRKVIFYSKAEEKEILKAYKSANQKEALKALAKALGRTYAALHYKGKMLAKKEGTYVPRRSGTLSFTPEQDSQLLTIGNMSKGQARKDAIAAFAKSSNRSVININQKIGRLLKASGVKRHYTKHTSPVKEARVSASTIRFPYRSIEIDTATQEIVVKV